MTALKPAYLEKMFCRQLQCKNLFNLKNVCACVCVYTYVYIERERERLSNAVEKLIILIILKLLKFREFQKHLITFTFPPIPPTYHFIKVR